MFDRAAHEEGEVSRQARLPVKTDASSIVLPFTETLTLTVASTNATDVGSAASEIVYAQMTKGEVLDSIGDRLATPSDTSAVVSSAPFSVYREFDWKAWNDVSLASRADKFEKFTEDWADGEYTVIPDSGVIIAKKASAGTTVTVTYKVRVAEMGVRKIIRPSIVTSDKDSHFTTAIAQNAKEEEDITGLPSSSGFIEAIHLTSDQNLDWDLYFFSSDVQTDTDLDVEKFLGVVTFVASDAKQIAGAGQYYYSTNNCSYPFHEFPYIDSDNTKELHVVLVNRNATSKNNGATGEVVLKVLFRPDSEIN